MKYNKLLISLAVLSTGVGVLFYAPRASAADLEFSVDIGFNNGSGSACSVTYNGSAGYLVKHVDPGDKVTINYTRSTQYPVGSVSVRKMSTNAYIDGFDVPYLGFKTVSYENIEESFYLRNTPSSGEYCGSGGNGTNAVQIYVDQPATETPTSHNPTPTPESTTPPQKKPTTPKPTTEPKAEAAPADSIPANTVQLGSITVGGKTIDTSKALQIKQNETLVLSGQANPNATVVLTIHSTPRTMTVQADAEGKWSYAIAGLEPGGHYVEASITDPATGNTSDRLKLISFSVAEENNTPKKSESQGTNSKAGILFVTVGVFIAIAAATVFILVKKGKLHFKFRK